MKLDEYKKAAAPSEEEEQRRIFVWAEHLRNKYPALDLLYHIPNEGKRTLSAGARLKAIGMKSGIPDLCLPHSEMGYNALYIELKTSGGKLTFNQAQWLRALSGSGNLALVCHRADEAIIVLMAYCKKDENTIRDFLQSTAKEVSGADV